MGGGARAVEARAVSRIETDSGTPVALAVVVQRSHVPTVPKVAAEGQARGPQHKRQWYVQR